MPRPVTKHARSEEWKPVTVIEIKKFLGLIFVTGIVQKPKLELYRSTRIIFQIPIFPQTMYRNRFQLIQRYLHFNDKNAAGTNEDRLYKIRTVLDIVVNNFRTNYIPDREISLDEGMLGWRGCLRFRVYNPGKITKYGTLVRMVCESSTGYILTCRLMMVNVDLWLKRWVFYSSLMKGRVTTYTKTIITTVSIKRMNYYRN